MHPLRHRRRWLPFAAPLLTGLLACWCLLAVAAPADLLLDTAQMLAQIRQQIDTAQAALKNSSSLSDAALQGLRETALNAQARADGIAQQLTPDMAAIDARLAGLGSPAAGTVEDAAIGRQRALLTGKRTALDAQIKLSRLLDVEAEQLAVQIWAARRSEFQQRLGQRTASILAAPFWAELVDDLPRDGLRLAALRASLAAAIHATPAAVQVVAASALAAALAGLWWLRRRLLRWLTSRSPSGRLRRSIHAQVVVWSWTLAAGLAALALDAMLDWRNTLPPPAAALLAQCTGMLWFSGFVYGLASALISADKPSWRLLAVPDAVAARLRWFPLQITLVSLATWLAERLAVLIDVSLATAVAVSCVVALAVCLTLTLALMRAERTWWRVDLARDGARPRPVWSKGLAALNWLVLLLAIASLLTGFVAFGSFAVKQLLWGTIVIGSGYLLTTLVDDVLMAWLADGKADDAGDGLAAAAKASAKTLAQMAVLASGAARLVLALLALTALLAPFGEGPADLWSRGIKWQESLTIGEFKLQPGAVVQALVVLGVGLIVVRLLRRWLADSYLPSTSLDVGMRLSATSLFGYAGIVVTIALAMSAMGVGLERIAWVASALSVGIGFGLQAVVQNFVSGVIMLTERPVKVGDWVSLGDVEGDIRRINVRATEIQLADRSTVIVPNSEFITKVVRNVTLADPLGLVQLKLPVPLDSDPQQVRDLLLQSLLANDSLLAQPAPSVQLEGIENGALMFNASGFVDSPRKSYGVRSAMLFDVLERLRAANIRLAKPPTMLIGAPAPPVTPLPTASAG